jgi:putative addiction module component (TIGR02574 family)
VLSEAELSLLQFSHSKVHFMAASIEQIATDLTKLPRNERLRLVRLLLDADRPSNVAEIDKAWDDEIRARVLAVNDGQAKSVSYQDLKREMNERFRR